MAAGDVHFIFHCISGVYSCMCFSPSKFRSKNPYSSNCDCAIFNKILWYQMFNLMANWMTVLYSPRCSRFWSFLAVASLIKVWIKFKDDGIDCLNLITLWKKLLEIELHLIFERMSQNNPVRLSLRLPPGVLFNAKVIVQKTKERLRKFNYYPALMQ